DVAGSLPKYLNQPGTEASVVMPYYFTEWIKSATTKLIYEGRAPLGNSDFAFRINLVEDPDMGFNLYLVDIPGRFDRPGVYIDPWSGFPYWDEKERFFSFQIATLEWLKGAGILPDVIHCHDHHSALVPFMTSNCFRYEVFHDVPSVLTIHNGEYQGRYHLNDYMALPAFNLEKKGLLEWDDSLNSLAAGIKMAWQVTTVSEGYMQELLEFCHGLESLLQQEQLKTQGIVNGIDEDVWDPNSDPFLHKNYNLRNYKTGKRENKKELLQSFNLDADRPLFSFIGRLVREKGADLLPDLIASIIDSGIEASFMVLGTGDPALHNYFHNLQSQYVGYFDTRLEYNEGLAHQIYAGSDFLLMPSRVEPCGLNQMYAMKYGTIPVVRATGGLKDTVKDLSEDNGYGFTFDNFNIEDARQAIIRAVELYHKKSLFDKTRRINMKLDFSWKKSAEKYIELYNKLLNLKE
ncbi:MAG: glycogen synthase, partial [Balneolaceae bacterium]